jgi:DNA polymerase-3 subunit delta'
MRDERDLPWLAEPLRALRDDSRGHAIILHGGQGSGLFDLAMRAAQAWLCERSPAPCDACASCHLVKAHSHTDLRVLMPETMQVALKWNAGGDTDTAEAEPADGESKSKRKPSKEIKVEAVRQAIDWAHTSSGRGRGKVLVFFPADAMNTVSANALLKTLEEPSPGMRLLLCVDDPERLLPTIRSRCQRVRLAPPAWDVANAWLQRQGVADTEALLRASGGEPLAALASSQEGLTAALWAALPAQVQQGDGRLLLAMSVPQALRALLQVCHDAMAVAAGAQARYFPAHHWPAGPDWAELVAWQQALTRAARFEDHPWNAGLLVEALLAQGGRALASSQVSQARGTSATAAASRVATLRT